jgi:hypothetical protein
VPSCENCVKRGQVCQGYGLRLSWPREDDVRRSATGSEIISIPIDASWPLHYVNVTPWDIELHQEHLDTGAHGMSIVLPRLQITAG